MVFPGVADALSESLNYVSERGKPTPSFSHGSIQGNLIGEFQSRYKIGCPAL